MKQILYRLFDHQYLTRQEAQEVMTKMADGAYNDAQIAAFISVFLMRSINLDEFLGFSDSLLEMRVNVDPLADYNPVDIVGTGGDGKNTFNISTAACFVVAGAGYKVAKHGNYGATSVSGASNVMEMHGVKFTNDISTLDRSLDKCNMAYLHAPLFNNAMKAVAPVRKALGVRTVFNMLGPVVNPIRPKRNVLGVFNLKMARMYYYIYQQKQADFAIVHSLDGYDEISLTGPFKLINNKGEFVLTPKDLDLPTAKEEDLFGGETPQEAAQIFDNVLSGKATASQTNAVLINAAVAIQTIDQTLSLEESIEKARVSIESGSALNTFKLFLELNS